MVSPKLLNTNEAAKVLDVTPGTLSVWRCRKRYALKFVRVGRNVRYRPEDIEAFLAARTCPGTAERDTKRRPKRSKPRP